MEAERRKLLEKIKQFTWRFKENGLKKYIHIYRPDKTTALKSESMTVMRSRNFEVSCLTNTSHLSL